MVYKDHMSHFASSTRLLSSPDVPSLEHNRVYVRSMPNQGGVKCSGRYTFPSFHYGNHSFSASVTQVQRHPLSWFLPGLLCLAADGTSTNGEANFAKSLNKSSNIVSNAKTRRAMRQLFMLFHLALTILTSNVIQCFWGHNVFLAKIAALPREV